MSANGAADRERVPAGELESANIAIRNVEWQLNPACDLHWRRWNDSNLVFNAGSGQTHILNELAASVLKRLESNSAKLEELVQLASVGEYLDWDTEDLEHSIAELVLDLVELGLVESCEK